MNSMFVPGAWWPVSRHTTARSQCKALNVRRPPVRDVCGIERGFEELVLEHETLVVAESGVDLTERVGESILSVPEISLSRGLNPSGSQIFRSLLPTMSMMSMHSRA